MNHSLRPPSAVASGNRVRSRSRCLLEPAVRPAVGEGQGRGVVAVRGHSGAGGWSSASGDPRLRFLAPGSRSGGAGSWGQGSLPHPGRFHCGVGSPTSQFPGTGRLAGGPAWGPLPRPAGAGLGQGNTPACLPARRRRGRSPVLVLLSDSQKLRLLAAEDGGERAARSLGRRGSLAAL